MSAMYDNLLANVPTDLWIGGKWRNSSDGGRFDVIDPATENKVASVASATVEDAKAALDAASAALPRLGRQDAARARRDPAQGVRADHARCRAAGEADHPRERQGALRFARRGRLRRGVLPLVCRRGGAQYRRSGRGPSTGARILVHHKPAGIARAGDAVEFPGRHGDAQDRPGARRRLYGRAQAGLRHAADHARPDADPGGGRRSGGRRQRHSLALLGQGGVRDAARSPRARGLLHRLDRGRPQAPARGRRQRGQAGDGARRQRALHRVRGRRHRRRDRRRHDRQDAQHGRGLHRGQPLLRARKGARRICRQAHRQDAGAEDGQRARRRRRARARWSTPTAATR